MDGAMEIKGVIDIPVKLSFFRRKAANYADDSKIVEKWPKIVKISKKKQKIAEKSL